MRSITTLDLQYAQSILNVISAQLMPFVLRAKSILSVSDNSLITTTGMYFSISFTFQQLNNHTTCHLQTEHNCLVMLCFFKAIIC